MTFNEFILSNLINCGMFPDQTQAVLELVKQAPENESMLGRWSDCIEDYPPEMKTMAWHSAKRYALQWIDENKPKAWYRGQFVEAK
mgnify:CR=1 FL=1